MGVFPKHACLLLMYCSGSRWPKCGQRVPDTQVMALVTEIAAQCGLPWDLRVAWTAATPQHAELFSVASGRSWQSEDISGDCKRANMQWISLTSVPGRATGQILMEAVFKYIMSKMTRMYQHGYRWGKSQLPNLVAFCDETTGFADEGIAVHVVYLEVDLKLAELLGSKGWTGHKVQLEASH